MGLSAAAGGGESKLIVYDAAVARAGMLRVITLDQLFQAAETLSRLRTNQAEQLTILTHGGGAGVMAADTVEWTARGLQWHCYR